MAQNYWQLSKDPNSSKYFLKASLKIVNNIDVLEIFKIKAKCEV